MIIVSLRNGIARRKVQDPCSGASRRPTGSGVNPLEKESGSYVQDFGANLKRLRKRRGLKQQDLAERLGVERPTVANWERGAKYPGLPLLVRLSEVLGVSVDALLGRQPPEVWEAPAAVAALEADPLVRRLSRRTGVPTRAIAAFLFAMMAGAGGNQACAVRGLSEVWAATRY